MKFSYKIVQDGAGTPTFSSVTCVVLGSTLVVSGQL